MDAVHFAASIRSLLEDSTLSDALVKCGDKEYKVHRSILSCHSEFFRKCFAGPFEEARTRTVELNEDHPEIVDLMIHYMYELDYDDTPKDGSDAKNALELNVMVYVIADKYECADLKDKAAKKVGLAVPPITIDEDRLAAIRFAYQSTSSRDRILRDVCLGLWMIVGERMNKAHKGDMIIKFLKEVPELAAEIAAAYTCMGTAGTFGTCACHCTGVQLKDALEHKFSEPKLSSLSRQPLRITQFWKA